MTSLAVAIWVAMVLVVGAPGDPVKGKEVFAAQKCNVCHKVNGVGGPIGPELGAIGLKRDAAWLAKYLLNPVPLDPKNPPKMKMQPTTAKGKDLDDLIAYLLSLKAKAHNPPSVATNKSLQGNK